MNKPILSIITSTYNSSKEIGQLIDSVRNSMNKVERTDIQWIVIDGKSVDETMVALRQSRDIIDDLVSEKDSGIYSAWNKGLRLAKGEFVAFIGSDDTIDALYLPTALESIRLYHDQYNVIAMKMAVLDNGKHIKTYHYKQWERPGNFPVNLGFFHCGTLFSKSLFELHAFDETFVLAGDMDHLVRVSDKLRPTIINTKANLIYHSMNGISGTRITTAYQEIIRILWTNRKKCRATDAYLRIMFLLIKYPITHILHK